MKWILQQLGTILDNEMDFAAIMFQKNLHQLMQNWSKKKRCGMIKMTEKI